MSIQFPETYHVSFWVPTLACISLPPKFHKHLVEILQQQEWVESVSKGIGAHEIHVICSRAYSYPPGEPQAALEGLCREAMEPEPVIDMGVWAEVVN